MAKKLKNQRPTPHRMTTINVAIGAM